MASHDLREPLRIMWTYSQLLARKYRGRLDAPAEQIMGYIVECQPDGILRERPRRVFERDGARRVGPFRAGGDEQGRGRCDPRGATLIQETGARVTHDDLPAVRGDGTQLVQVLQNLIDNAIQYSKREEAPCIHITGRRDAADAVFSVRANGMRILPAYQAQVFGNFKRLSRSGSGTGISLPLCQRIVEKHHGTIWVESEPGKGSPFSFTVLAARHCEIRQTGAL